MNADRVFEIINDAIEEQNEKANERIKEFHPAHKAIIDMAAMLLGGGPSDYVDMPVEKLTERIMLKLYFFAQFDSCLASGDYEDTTEFEDRFLTFVTDRGYDITKEQLVEKREAAQELAMETSGIVAAKKFTAPFDKETRTMEKALKDFEDRMSELFEDFK